MKTLSTFLKGYALTLVFSFAMFGVFAQGSNCSSATALNANGSYSADGPSDGAGCYNCTGATHADWFYFTAPKNGNISVSACGRGLNAADSRLWIYGGTCAVLTQVAANDDACGLTDGYAAAINNMPVLSGSTYFLEWDNRWTDAGFTFDFTFVPECNNPTNIVFSEVTNNSFIVNWTSSNPGADFTLEYGSLGFIPGLGLGTEITGVVGVDNPVSITGLNAGTNYSVYIQEDCGSNAQTTNVGPNNQTTKFNAPPANNLCTNAAVAVCGQIYNGSIVNATEADNPSGVCGTSSTSPGVWFSHVGTGDRITLSLCASNYDTKLMVFQGACQDFVCVSGNDNSSDCTTLNRSKLSFNTTLNANYLIFVSGANNVVGNYVMNVSCASACQNPSNDYCAGATALTIAPQGECNFTAGTNVCADLATKPNQCEAAVGIADVWYSFNTGTLNDVILSLTQNTAGLMKYAIYDACGVAELSCGSLTGITSEFISDLDANTTYYIQIWNGGGVDAGSFNICLSAPIGSGFEETSNVDAYVSMYPNPVNGDLITIQGTGEMQINMVSIDGKQVFQGVILKQGQVDLTGFESGVYLVNIIQDGKSNMLRLIKE